MLLPIFAQREAFIPIYPNRRIACPAVRKTVVQAVLSSELGRPTGASNA